MQSPMRKVAWFQCLSCQLTLTWGQRIFSHLLNPDWSIQISRAPTVCKATVGEPEIWMTNQESVWFALVQWKISTCGCTVLAPKCSCKGPGDELALLYIYEKSVTHLNTRLAIIGIHPLKHHVKSCVKMCGLPNRIVSSISLRICQPFKCNFIFKTQIFHLLCSLTVADYITVGNQFRNKAVICTTTVAFKFK